jgi:ribonuclease P protein component
MLKRANRLKEKELFQRLFSHGKRFFIGNVAGFSLSAKNDTLVIGVTFKQKTFRTAVLRHRYKRGVLAWVRAHLAEFPQGRAVIIHFQQPFERYSSDQLEQTLSKFLEKLKKL